MTAFHGHSAVPLKHRGLTWHKPGDQFANFNQVQPRGTERRPSRRDTTFTAMKNFEEEQRKMRERMAGAQPKRALTKRSAKARNVKFSQPSDLNALLNRIAALEAENASLKLQLAKSGDQQDGSRVRWIWAIVSGGIFS